MTVPNHILEKQREAILRFYAAMTTTSYDEVVSEYLGKTKQPNFANRLYRATEMAVNYMNEPKQEGGPEVYSTGQKEQS